MMIKVKNLQYTIKGLNLFGLIITTKKSLEKIPYSADLEIIDTHKTNTGSEKKNE